MSHRTGYFGTAQVVAYQQMVLLLYRHLGRGGEALEYVERSRSRAFLDQFGYAALAAPPHADSKLLRCERELVGVLRAKEAILRQRSSDELPWELLAEVEDLQWQLNLILAELEHDSPDYIALRRGAAIPLRQVRELLSERTPW
jgi:hypothetical protein